MTTGIGAQDLANMDVFKLSLWLSLLCLYAVGTYTDDREEILEKEAAIQPDEVASPPHGLKNDDSINQSATKVAYAKLHESNNDGQGRNLVTDPIVVPPLLTVLARVFSMVSSGTTIGKNLASFLGETDLENVNKALSNIGGHLKEMSLQLDVIQKKLDLILQENLRIKFEMVQLFTEKYIATIQHQLSVMTNMVNGTEEPSWIDGERIRVATSDALTSLMSTVNGEYGLISSLIQISSALENDVSELNDYWSTIELYRSRCKYMMLVALTVLSYCNEIQDDILSNSTLVTHAKSVVNSIEVMYTTNGVAPPDGSYLHVKGREYVLAKFDKGYCGSKNWEEQYKNSGGNFTPHGDCSVFLYGSPNKTGSDAYGDNRANYYFSMSIYNELVIARDAYLASDNYGLNFQKAFNSFIWRNPGVHQYGAWGYDVTHTGGRGLNCARQFPGQGSIFTGDIYQVTVKDNDVKRWNRESVTSTCADMQCTTCSVKYEQNWMARNAYGKARTYTLNQHEIIAPYYMVLKINGKLDAGGRFVSFDPDAINATIYSTS